MSGAVSAIGDGVGASLTVTSGVTGLVRFQGAFGGNSGVAAPGAASALRFDADVTLADGGTATDLAGSVQLDGLTFSCFDGLTLGAVTLSGGPVVLDSNAYAISLGSVTGGGQDLQLISRTATSTVSANVSGVGTITLHDDNAASTGALTFGGSLGATALGTWARAYAVSLNAGGTVANAVTFLNSGLLTVGNDDADSMTFAGGVTHTAGSTAVRGTVSTTDTGMTFGVVSASGTAVLSSGTGAIQTGAVTLADGAALTVQNSGPGTVTIASVAGTAAGAASDLTIDARRARDRCSGTVGRTSARSPRRPAPPE